MIAIKEDFVQEEGGALTSLTTYMDEHSIDAITEPRYAERGLNYNGMWRPCWSFNLSVKGHGYEFNFIDQNVCDRYLKVIIDHLKSRSSTRRPFAAAALRPSPIALARLLRAAE